MQTADRTTQDAPATPLALERYRLVRRLGHGAFGVVWLAHDERLDRMVAVKRIELHDEQVAARAEREAVAAARLSHPAIVTLYEAGRDEHAVHLVSELVRGPTLADLIEAGALSDRDVMRIGVALCAALDHAHARGIIHRDVKPANVIVPERPSGEAELAKLTDFGVAAIAGDGALTRTGDIVGTLAYMAPEQADAGLVTGSADLYALALVLYEALSGSNPVRAPGAGATARRVGMRLPSLARQRPDLPRPLCDALDRALQRDEQDRGTLTDLRTALEIARDHADRVVGPIEPARGGGRRRVEERAPLSSRIAPAAGAGVACATALTLLSPAATLSTGAAAGASASAALLVALMPRAGWIASASALIALMLMSGFAGVAVLLAAAALATTLILQARGALWSAPVAAVATAMAGLALAWPAAAGQATSFHSRAALGALGLWWCLLAEQLIGRALVLGAFPATQPAESWRASAGGAGHVLWDLISSGAPLLAIPWALAAAVLPLIVRGRWLALDVVAVTAWAAGLASGTVAVAATLDWPAGPPQVRGVIAGAVVAGAVALLAAAARAPQEPRDVSVA